MHGAYLEGFHSGSPTVVESGSELCPQKPDADLRRPVFQRRRRCAPQVPKPDVMLTTHEVVTSEALSESLAGLQWDVMLLDQVQGLILKPYEP